MKTKALAIFGLLTYVMSIFSSAESIEGVSVAPTSLIALSGISTITFILLATIRLWREAKSLAISYVISGFVLFGLTTLQVLTSAPYGSAIIILMNMAKVVNFVMFIVVVIRLFRIRSGNHA